MKKQLSAAEAISLLVCRREVLPIDAQETSDTMY